MAPTRRTKRLLLLSVLGAAALGLPAVPAVRQSALQAAGHWLVSDDPLAAADAVIVAVDARGAGVLEAADLVAAGLAPRVAVFGEPPLRSDVELARRGLPGYDDASIAIGQLRTLGVATAERVGVPVQGTEDEGATLALWCAAHGIRTAILVSNADHTRRTRRIMARATAGSAVRILVRASRYSDFDPDRWWRSRLGLRTGIVELQKLLFDLLRHPVA